MPIMRVPTVLVALLVSFDFVSLPAIAPLHAQAPVKKLKVFISVDMEGVVGTVTGDQLGPSGFEYARFREFMTREALAAVAAAKEAGAT
jgi:hypothetical protein